MGLRWPLDVLLVASWQLHGALVQRRLAQNARSSVPSACGPQSALHGQMRRLSCGWSVAQSTRLPQLGAAARRQVPPPAAALRKNTPAVPQSAWFDLQLVNGTSICLCYAPDLPSAPARCFNLVRVPALSPAPSPLLTTTHACTPADISRDMLLEERDERRQAAAAALRGTVVLAEHLLSVPSRTLHCDAHEFKRIRGLGRGGRHTSLCCLPVMSPIGVPFRLWCDARQGLGVGCFKHHCAFSAVHTHTTAMILAAGAVALFAEPQAQCVGRTAESRAPPDRKPSASSTLALVAHAAFVVAHSLACMRRCPPNSRAAHVAAHDTPYCPVAFLRLQGVVHHLHGSDLHSLWCCIVHWLQPGKATQGAVEGRRGEMVRGRLAACKLPCRALDAPPLCPCPTRVLPNTNRT